jgi:hypothetical protein
MRLRQSGLPYPNRSNQPVFVLSPPQNPSAPAPDRRTLF